MTGPGPTAATPTSLENAWRLLRARWWILALSAAVVGGVFVARAVTTEKTYTATATVLVRQSSLLTLIDPGARPPDPARAAATNLLLARSNDVAELVRASLRSPLDVSGLLDRIDVTNEPDTDLLDLTASDPDPEGAARLANAFADQFVVFRRASDRRLAGAGARTLQQQLAALPDGDSRERRELLQALRKVRALQAVTTGDVEVASRASASSTPAAPLPKRSAVVGVTLGLGLGALVVVLLELLDRRLRRPEEVAALTGLPVLATVPTEPDGPARLDALRIVRSGLEARAPDARTVLVTSAVAGEGASALAGELARAYALAGLRVALVEMDLRRPTMATRFDLPAPGRGLTTALVGGLPVRELVQPAIPGLRSLVVLPGGPPVPNAPELLRSAALGAVLDELHALADVLVLDAPPLLPVADARVLLDRDEVDACLVVARLGRTTDDEARRMRAVLAARPGVPAALAVLGD
ncbi:polysaccharide biosynthesis tyrosine autokinase [Paraconexibacter algicola]|uniref:polysaccharide biosynthesis tyrosine autokinase n=1 Tax=Paraconexibacter algicola TaxID=2133960 RepID=UPI0013048D1D|nr:polysaccharide biosynthesis tyrosine autokinase [Paraconexibacter algicola]